MDGTIMVSKIWILEIRRLVLSHDAWREPEFTSGCDPDSLFTTKENKGKFLRDGGGSFGYSGSATSQFAIMHLCQNVLGD